ncbi:hypothetical protein PR202_gb04531 [Eleusine coracana subsp. coracana]|uniref:Uncharacterized protein n=1 Tax=Eleusine coracana subsp. coracana TaxID=191504 RepID=A0AAV5E4C8_ELECO|nr:hypothetical protein PR202_gb04531 [Eleusine coracana subsp. coracana]
MGGAFCRAGAGRGTWSVRWVRKGHGPWHSLACYECLLLVRFQAHQPGFAWSYRARALALLFSLFSERGRWAGGRADNCGLVRVDHAVPIATYGARLRSLLPSTPVCLVSFRRYGVMAASLVPSVARLLLSRASSSALLRRRQVCGALLAASAGRPG